MNRVIAPALLVAALLSASHSAVAQPDSWHTLRVPAAAFEVTGVPVEGARAQNLLRMIRVLHTVPPSHPDVAPMNQTLAALLSDMEHLTAAVAALPGAGIAPPRSWPEAGREHGKAALKAAGLRLREVDGQPVVEADGDGRARERRRRLLHAGVDADALMARLNAGETVRIAPQPAVEVPLPLAPDVWANAVFQRAVAPDALFAAIVSDRRAALLYYGLCALPPETRTFLTTHPDLLQWIYRERAGTLAAYGGSVRVVNGHVDVPGGDPARALWESMVGRSPSRPADFIKELFDRDEGRLAYLYESIDGLDARRQRFALGLAEPDAGIRLDRLRALYRAFVGIEAEWAHAALPFSRPMYDAAMLFHVAHVTPEGTLGAPASRRLWRLAFASSDLPDDADAELRDPAAEGALDAAAIGELVVLAPARYRRDRFEAFAFGQRVFATARAEQLGDVLVGLRAFSKFPAVLLVLERLGVTAPGVYAAAARHARAIDRVEDPARHIALQAQFQGALGVLDRLARTGRLERGQLEPLLRTLFATSPSGALGYQGSVARWLEQDLLPAVAADAGVAAAEQVLLASFADGDADAHRRFDWEGLAYEVDLAAAERKRIGEIRAKQDGNSLDGVLAFWRDAIALNGKTLSVDRVQPAIAALRAHASSLAPARAWPGIDRGRVPDVPNAIDRAVRDLLKLRQPRHVSNVDRIAASLVEVADYLLGEVLVALVYAPLLGNPADLVGGEADLSHRHDFGAGTRLTAEARDRTPWLRPRQPNTATVLGGLLGLDLALAPRALRRLVSDRVPDVPRLQENDRDVFTTSVVLMNPRRLTDEDLHAVAEAIKAGRTRIGEAAADLGRLDALAAAAHMSPARRQLLGWAVRNEPQAVEDLFSAMELFQVGSTAERIDREVFGLAAEALTGCYCSRFPPPGPWEPYSGRPGTGQLATRVPDLTLRLVELLDELRAPALLLPAVLSLATQDFIDEVQMLYADDWPAVVAYARAVSRERVEDYVASLTAGGPLRPARSNQP